MGEAKTRVVADCRSAIKVRAVNNYCKVPKVPQSTYSVIELCINSNWDIPIITHAKVPHALHVAFMVAFE